MHGGQKSGRARLEQRLSAPGVPWEGGIAVRGTLNAVPAPRDYFSPVSALRGHRGKIVPRSAARILGTWQPTVARPPRAPMAIPRAAVSPCRVLHTTDWEGEQALSGLTLFDARTGIACASTTGSWSRERWVILVGEIKGYPEMCAELGLSHSTSAPASSLSTFFIIFFC